MNYTRAAAELNITQPAVSQHIRHLEQEYKAKLFVYTGKHLALTQAGRILLRMATAVSHDDAVLKERLRGMEQRHQFLALGTTPAVDAVGIEDKVAAYLQGHQEVNLRWEMNSTGQLLRAVDEGRLDVAIVDQQGPWDAYEVRTLSQESLVPVCQCTALVPTTLTIPELLQQQIIIQTKESGASQALEKELAQQQLGLLDFPKRHEVTTPELAKTLACLGCGIAFVYEKAVQHELAQGLLRIIQVPDFTLSHAFFFVWRKGSEYAPFFSQLYDQLRF